LTFQASLSKIYLKFKTNVLACADMGTNTRSAGADGDDPDRVLTQRQRKIIKVIEDSVRTRGYPPTLREIAEAVGLASTSSLAFQITTLRNMGYLGHEKGRP
jgi:repressor LexA